MTDEQVERLIVAIERIASALDGNDTKGESVDDLTVGDRVHHLAESTEEGLQRIADEIRVAGGNDLE